MYSSEIIYMYTVTVGVSYSCQVKFGLHRKQFDDTFVSLNNSIAWSTKVLSLNVNQEFPVDKKNV
jgi:hypothetical protein